MKEEKILQLTEIDNKDNANKNFLLGAWCKKYKDVIEKNKYNGFVQEHHWKNRNKRDKDIIYIENLYEELIVHLKDTLNNFHREKKNDLYWRIIIGPWLQNYIAALFDRWETISKFFSENPHNFKINYFHHENDSRVFKDCKHFEENASYGNKWNQLIFYAIIKKYYLDRVEINKTNLNTKSQKDTLNWKIIHPNTPIILFKKLIKKLTPTILSYIIFLLKIKFNKIIIIDLEVNYKHFLEMCFSLKVIPNKNFLFLEDYIKIHESLYNLNVRKNIFIDKKHENKFEDFLFKNIFIDIPITYLEGYKIIKKKINPILTEKKKIILSNYSHVASDQWKIWIAEMLLRKSKLITYMHGGGFVNKYHDFKCSEPIHELKISTKRISWFKHSNNPSVQLSPLKTIKFKNIKYNNKNKFLSIIQYEMFLHIINPESYPYAEENIDQLENCFELIKNVNPEIYDMTKFKMADYGSSRYDAWYKKKLILKEYGSSKLYSKYKNTYDVFNQSKFVILTYPLTVLSELLISNVPFALFYDPSHWVLNKDSEDMINIMKENKLYFENPKQLSNHLNNIWPSINEWWNSQTVLDVRNYLKNRTTNLNENWKNEWVTFLRGIN